MRKPSSAVQWPAQVTAWAKALRAVAEIAAFLWQFFHRSPIQPRPEGGNLRAGGTFIEDNSEQFASKITVSNARSASVGINPKPRTVWYVSRLYVVHVLQNNRLSYWGTLI